MKKIFIPILIILLIVLAFMGIKLWNSYKGVYFANKPASKNIVNLIQSAGVNQTNFPLKIPAGFSLSVYAQNLIDPRVLATDPTGTIIASLTSAGKVVAIINREPMDVITGLNNPHGLAFNGNKLYIAETNQVAIYDYDPVFKKAVNKHKILDLPGGGEHFTRTLLIKNNQLYISIGSDCNACVETDSHRASIWVSNLDGTNFRSFATGLRNSVFMTVNPQTDEIWATNMGRDFLGDNLPPDTINIINAGANYGWPYCYGNKIIDSELNRGGAKFDCNKMNPPIIEIPAHSAPLGLAFMGKAILIAYHGSWNRSVPTGYKIVEYTNGTLQDFITGWLQPNGDVLGRPVDILVKSAKEIYISDDKAGVIYLLKAN